MSIHPHARQWAIAVALASPLLDAATQAQSPKTQPYDPSPTPVLRSEFIYTTAPFPSCHASTIVETDGELVAAWFGGTAERNPDVGIWLSRRQSEGWTEPVEVANGVQSPDLRFPTWNPVLFQPTSGPLMLFYKVGPSPDAWWGVVKTSSDAGRTWSPPRRLPDGILGPIKNKPIQLPDGTILAGSSSEDHGWRVHFERSTDGGKTWSATPPLNNPQKIRAIQPSLLTYADGRLQAVGRTRSSGIFQIWSDDLGKTWGEMGLAGLPNPSAGTDAVTLADGRQLIVYNHTSDGRTPLNVALSHDGKSWDAALVLENAPQLEFSYPAVIQTSDGLVHFTYTWHRKRVKHVVVQPNLLKPLPINKGQWPVAIGRPQQMGQ
jgi:predicted neuraminidase